MVLSLAQLLVSLPVQVDERVDEVGDACTYVHKVDNNVFKIEVEQIWHVKNAYFLSPNATFNEIDSSYFITGIVLITRS